MFNCNNAEATVYDSILVEFKLQTAHQILLIHFASFSQRRVGGHRQDWLSALQALQRSEAEKVEEENWILEPVGDGTTEHLANRTVDIPGAFRLSTDAATVGRLAGKADIVIPIATVSGLHAQLERGEGNIIFVTDLGSTNGTYVDSKKIKPRTVTPVTPGSRITFGDQHLASFRLSKLEVVHA